MAKSELLHRRPQHRLEDVGLAHEAEVVGVGGVGGAFGVVAVEMVAGDVTEFGDAFFLELVVGSAEGGVVVVVEFLFAGSDPVIGEATVFDEDDGGVGAGGAELFHERHAFGRHVGGTHVGQAIDHVGGGIDLGEEVADGGIHAAVAGEANVDDGAVEAAAEDGGVDHAGARGARAVGDGGAVEDDGFLGARGEALELRAGRDADGEGFNAVVEREVGGVFAQAGGEVADEGGLDFRGTGAGDLHPLPLAVGVARIEVEAADAGGGHVGHGEVGLGEGVAGVDGLRVGLEADHHAGAVAAEAPDGGGDFALGLGGEAVEPFLAFLIGPAAAFDAPRRDIMPRGVGGDATGAGRRGFGRGLLGEGGGGEDEGEGERKEEGGFHGGVLGGWGGGVNRGGAGKSN